MASFLVDTDVFVDHLRGSRRVPVAPVDSAYTTITRAELYAGSRADEGVIDALLGAFEEIAVDRRVAEEGGRIGREHALTLPDALTAAAARVSGRVLVTCNARDFSRVPGLDLHSPRD